MKSFKLLLRACGMLLLASFGATVCATEAPVRIMPLGDSLTSGTLPGAYRNRLYTLLTSAGYNVDFVGTHTDASNPTLPDIDHQGTGGVRIDEIQTNIAGWLNSVEDPDVVLLLAGTNDFSQNYSTASATTRLTNLIADIAARRPFAKIIVSNLPLRTDSATLEAQQVTFNSALPGIVSNQVSLGHQVSLVDMHSAWGASDLAEGVHPNQGGYDKMAAVWLPGITNVISPQGTANPPAIVRTGPP
ncbi:MAG: SGNH/GDSL hydrolase family protein, partial [Luteolibacter sp.]